MIGVRWWIALLSLMSFCTIVLLTTGDTTGFAAWFWAVYAVKRIFDSLDEADTEKRAK